MAQRAETRKAATPWGQASVVEQVKVAQRAGDRRFASVVELLQSEQGERLLRIAYTTDGVARRGPVTLRAKDVDRLRSALTGTPGIAALLGLPGGEA